MMGLRLAAVVMIAVIAIAVGVVLVREKSGEPLLADQRFEGLLSDKPQTIDVSVEGLDPAGRFYKDYTCDGENRAPKVEASGIPAGLRR